MSGDVFNLSLVCSSLTEYRIDSWAATSARYVCGFCPKCRREGSDAEQENLHADQVRAAAHPDPWPGQQRPCLQQPVRLENPQSDYIKLQRTNLDYVERSREFDD